jgi:hypothetical protein
MEGFSKCDKGHFYKDNLDACPYCPGNSGNSNAGGGLSDKTQIVGGGMDTKIEGGGGNDKTQIFGGGASNRGASNSDKTQIFGGGQAASGGRDLSKTFISGMEETADGGAIQKARATRKITGWIVSYSIDPMGVDFRIYEGKNRIGKDPSLEITLATDNTISGTHAIILFRTGKWYLEDEMSANGTFLNGEELPPRNPVEIADNDIIKVGATEFKFKTSI